MKNFYLVFWVVAAFVFIVPMGFYFLEFSGSLSSDPEKWAFFGSYVAGAVGAPMQFLAVAGLIITLRSQQKQLDDQAQSAIDERVEAEQLVRGCPRRFTSLSMV